MEANAPTTVNRKHERVSAAMPVRLEDALGTTRDVSASGVYFEIDCKMAVGSEISFEIEMSTLLGPMKMKSRGRIVRVEQKDGRAGIAVTMIDSLLEAV